MRENFLESNLIDSWISTPIRVDEWPDVCVNCQMVFSQQLHDRDCRNRLTDALNIYGDGLTHRFCGRIHGGASLPVGSPLLVADLDGKANNVVLEYVDNVVG